MSGALCMLSLLILMRTLGIINAGISLLSKWWTQGSEEVKGLPTAHGVVKRQCLECILIPFFHHICYHNQNKALAFIQKGTTQDCLIRFC